MTTTIKVTSHNYPAQVRLVSRYVQKQGPDGPYLKVENTVERILRPEDGEVTFHCTTTQAVECIDLDYNDPRVLALTDPNA